jgi:hypothetical protein
MRTGERYTLSSTPDGRRRTLVRRGAAGPGVPVDGAVIEAQHALPDGGALVWLTDDSPHEEGLHVYLLGTDDRVRDAVEAGAMWAPGLLEIRATGDGWADFAFFRNGSVYRLEVADRAAVRLRLPRGWRYKSLLSGHRLVVRRLGAGDDRGEPRKDDAAGAARGDDAGNPGHGG